MNRTTGLLILFAVAAGALLVWQLALRKESAPERAGPARATREAPPEPPDVPAPKAPDETGKPAEPDEPAPAQPAVVTEGVRIRVVADGQPLPDAHVYATIGQEPQVTRKEEGGTWLASATGDVTVGAAHAKHGPVRRKVHAEPGTITEVTLELGKGETIDVLVIADRGAAPIAGASVYVLRAGGKDLDGGNAAFEDLFEEEEEIDFPLVGTLDITDLFQLGGAPAVAIPRLLTGADGRARVEGLPPGTVDIVVSHPEFVPRRLRSTPVGKEAIARLSEGGSLTVLAPYVDGRAAEGYLCGAPVGHRLRHVVRATRCFASGYDGAMRHCSPHGRKGTRGSAGAGWPPEPPPFRGPSGPSAAHPRARGTRGRDPRSSVRPARRGWRPRARGSA